MDRQTTGLMLQKIRRDAEALPKFVAALCDDVAALSVENKRLQAIIRQWMVKVQGLEDDVAKWRRMYDEVLETKSGG